MTALAAGFLSISMMAQKNPKLNAGNIDEVLAAMTLEEKAQLLVGGANNFFSQTAVMGNFAQTVPGAAGTTATIERLGIPETIVTDGPAGVHIDGTRPGTSKTFYATGFPIGTCLASTWNTELVKDVGRAIGNETKAYKCDVILGPGMNIHRNPLCGRNFEYYSEDPILTGRIGTAYVQGVQSEGVGVSLKHFAVNSQETQRVVVDERLSVRALREIYLRGFEMVVREANPWTVMSSYNRINGVFAQGNYDLLTKTLREEWGFRGIVMTDWIGRRTALPVRQCVWAGNDLFMPGQPEQSKDIVDAVNNGTLNIKDVDRNVRYMLEYIVKTPSFNKTTGNESPDLKIHAQITRQSATEGMVLLKNQNATLPMKNIKTVALFGTGSYHFLSGGVGSGCVHTPYIVDMVEGLKNAGISSTPLLTDIYRKYIDYAKLKFEADRNPMRWFENSNMGDQKYPEIAISQRSIISEVSKADAAIITISRQAGEGVDRIIDEEFGLTTDEKNLVSDVCAIYHQADKPVIVIINSGSVLETASWRHLPDAILVAWQPGEEGGNSVADILTGKVNPSGRLPMTWPLSVYDHPSTANFPQDKVEIYDYETLKSSGYDIPNRDYTMHSEDIWVGYRHFDTNNKPVAYPFGFGLSYTTFEYGKPAVKRSGNQITVSITIRNTGKMAGKEVAQVYVSAPKAAYEKPAKELKAFGKTRLLAPGQSETLKMTLNVRDLASFSEKDNQWVADAGAYTFMVGSNVEKINGSATLNLERYTEKVSDAFVSKK